jgi:hypothetical protein
VNPDRHANLWVDSATQARAITLEKRRSMVSDAATSTPQDLCRYIILSLTFH